MPPEDSSSVRTYILGSGTESHPSNWPRGVSWGEGTWGWSSLNVLLKSDDPWYKSLLRSYKKKYRVERLIMSVQWPV